VQRPHRALRHLGRCLLLRLLVRLLLFLLRWLYLLLLLCLDLSGLWGLLRQLLRKLAVLFDGLVFQQLPLLLCLDFRGYLLHQSVAPCELAAALEFSGLLCL
jgi:hypothetical protein